MNTLYKIDLEVGDIVETKAGVITHRPAAFVKIETEDAQLAELIFRAVEEVDEGWTPDEAV